MNGADKILEYNEPPGERLDAFLAREIEGLTRSRVQQLIREGLVEVGSRVPKQSYLLKPGDCIKVRIPPPVAGEVLPEPLPLEIFYEDEHLLVVNKPRGMVVHPAPGHYTGTLVNALLFHCRDLSGIGGVLRPGIVHRLDKDTSGLLLVAKHDVSHRDLSRQLKDKKVHREYVALVWGRMQKLNLEISAPIARHPRFRKKMAVVAGGREALTGFKVLAYLNGCTLVRARLRTGRTHQVRVHLSYLNHPVVGDPLYGGRENELKEINWRGQALHARKLGFIHPCSGEYMRFVAPLPPGFRRLIQYLRRQGKGEK